MTRLVTPQEDGRSTDTVSVVVPCYNEVTGVVDSVRAIARAMSSHHGAWEIVCVDDGSTDGTGDRLESLSRDHPVDRIRLIRLPVNRGYGFALKVGVRQATGDLIVITDADGTYPAECIPQLVGQCRVLDMVVGSRTGDGVHYSNVRRIPKMFLRRYVSWVVGEDVPDMNSGLRVFRRALALRYLPILPDGFSFTTTITIAMMRSGHAVRFTPISYARRVGRSKIQPIRDTIRFFGLITRIGMYFAPLRILAPMCLVLGVAFMASLSRDLYRGDLTEATLLLLLFCVNAGMLGLLGDMIDKRGAAN
jgi:glycosyltransferase involved in cell wall biosynthesis